jgi:hypothetical protein
MATTRSSGEIEKFAPLRGFPASIQTNMHPVQRARCAMCTRWKVHAVESVLWERHRPALDGLAVSMGEEEEGEEGRRVRKVFMSARGRQGLSRMGCDCG